jgi:hypothetical protein
MVSWWLCSLPLLGALGVVDLVEDDVTVVEWANGPLQALPSRWFVDTPQEGARVEMRVQWAPTGVLGLELRGQPALWTGNWSVVVPGLEQVASGRRYRVAVCPA